ncbi:MAG: hypothetical protein NZ455_15940 [Bacteroidia bacterium]|nr:hypothetical protein [Bacteroidia bacterium]
MGGWGAAPLARSTPTLPAWRSEMRARTRPKKLKLNLVYCVYCLLYKRKTEIDLIQKYLFYQP